MKILVCVKIVPDIEMVIPSDWQYVKNFQKAGIGYVNNIINVFDQSALELALRLKDASIAARSSLDVCVLYVGGSTGDSFLRSALSLHADRALRIDCGQKKLSSPEEVASTIYQAVETVGPFDLIFFGMQASPLDQAQTGLIFAEKIGWPCVSHVNEVTLTAEEAVILHQNDIGIEKIRIGPPAVLIVGNTNEMSLRIPSLKDKLEADQKTVDVLKLVQTKISKGPVFSKRMIGFTSRSSHRRCEIINGQGIEQNVKTLMDVISNETGVRL